MLPKQPITSTSSRRPETQPITLLDPLHLDPTADYTWGDWVRWRLHHRDLDMDQKELVEQVNLRFPDIGLTEGYLSHLLGNAKTPKGTLKKPSPEKAIAVAKVLNTNPAQLHDDIDASLYLAGRRPQR